MINVEIKARCELADHQRIRGILMVEEAGTIVGGQDRQIDTYFVVPNGRLKLRESEQENFLIQYDRPDHASPKVSKFRLTPVPSGSALKASLEAALGVKVVVDKERFILFNGIVKFHLDFIHGLGCFVEIEVRDEKEQFGLLDLTSQCRSWMEKLGIKEESLVNKSYSDLVMLAIGQEKVENE